MNVYFSKLTLGTAQFGSKYGISNINEKEIPFLEMKKILNFAQKNQILSLDTANSYGNCEEKLVILELIILILFQNYLKYQVI